MEIISNKKLKNMNFEKKFEKLNQKKADSSNQGLERNNTKKASLRPENVCNLL
jgi:hypothetical protein